MLDDAPVLESLPETALALIKETGASDEPPTLSYTHRQAGGWVSEQVVGKGHPVYKGGMVRYV